MNYVHKYIQTILFLFGMHFIRYKYFLGQIFLHLYINVLKFFCYTGAYSPKLYYYVVT